TVSLAKVPPSDRKRSRRWPLVAAAVLLLGGGVGLWQVLIHIKTKDGETQVKVPPGATVTVEKDGKVVAKVDGAGQGGIGQPVKGEEVDLLKLIDPDKHALRKNVWRFEGITLVSPKDTARIQVPYTP